MGHWALAAREALLLLASLDDLIFAGEKASSSMHNTSGEQHRDSSLDHVDADLEALFGVLLCEDLKLCAEIPDNQADYVLTGASDLSLSAKVKRFHDSLQCLPSDSKQLGEDASMDDAMRELLDKDDEYRHLYDYFHWQRFTLPDGLEEEDIEQYGAHLIDYIIPSCPSVATEDSTNESHLQEETFSSVKKVDGSSEADSMPTTNMARGQVININDLPGEILCRIMGYLSQYELLHGAALVCRYWKSLAYDPIHWQHLVLSHSVAHKNVLNIVARMPLLKHLELCSLDTLCSTTIDRIADCCPMIQQLELSFCDYLTYKVVERMCERMQGLTSVNLEGCRLVGEQSVQLLATLPRLSTVQLAYCSLVTTTSICHLAHCLSHIFALNIDGISQIRNE